MKNSTSRSKNVLQDQPPLGKDAAAPQALKLIRRPESLSWKTPRKPPRRGHQALSSHESDDPGVRYQLLGTPTDTGLPQEADEKAAKLSAGRQKRAGPVRRACLCLRSRFCGTSKRSAIPLLLIAILIEGMAEMSRGVLVPSFTQNMSRLELSIAAIGWVVALFSAGRLALSYVFGWAMYRIPVYVLLTIALFLGVTGNALYAAAIPAIALIVYPARFISGAATGTLSVARALITIHTSDADRLRLMSCLDAVRFVGYAVSPGLGGVLTSFGSENPDSILNRFSMPAWFLVIAGIAAFVPVICYHARLPVQERHPHNTALSSSSTESVYHSRSWSSEEFIATDIEGPVAPLTPICSSSMEEGDEGRQSVHSERHGAGHPLRLGGKDEPPSMPAWQRWMWIVVFCLTNAVVRGTVALLEATIGVLYANVISDDESDLSQDTGSYMLALGIGGFVLLVALAYYSQHFNPELLLFSGLTITTIGILILIPDAEKGDMNIAQWRFIAGCVLVWTIGSVIASTSTSAAFSMQLHGKPVGLLMAIYGSSGSIGRIVFPAAAGASVSNGKLKPISFIIVFVLCALLAVIHGASQLKRLIVKCCKQRGRSRSSAPQSLSAKAPQEDSYIHAQDLLIPSHEGDEVVESIDNNDRLQHTV